MRYKLSLVVSLLCSIICIQDGAARKISDFHYEICVGDDEYIVNEEAKQGFQTGLYDDFRGASWHNDSWCTSMDLDDPNFDWRLHYCFLRPVTNGVIEHWVTKKSNYSQVKFKFYIDVKAPASVSFSELSETYEKGDYGNFEIELGGDFPSFGGNGYFQYEITSSDPSVLKVEMSNKNICSYRALTTGWSQVTAVVYARNSACSNANYKVGTISKIVTVSGGEPTGISIYPEEITLGVNQTKTLNYTLIPSDANCDVTWKSDNPSVASVSSAGVVTGKKIGETVISAKTTNGLISTCKISVRNRHIVNGINYEIDSYNNLTVCPLPDGKYNGRIEIPKEVYVEEKLRTVDGIGEEAFKDCVDLESITLPEGIIIGPFAFYGCNKLSSIRLDNIKFIDTSAFEGCQNLKSVQIILDFYNTAFMSNAFSNCDNIKKVYINDLNKWVNISINGNATGNPLWEGGADLYVNGEKIVNLNVPVPKSKSLGFGIFGRCGSIESINLSEGIERIKGRVFQNCSQLREITLPATLKQLEGYAFAWCDAIQTVNCYATVPPDMETGWNDYEFEQYFAFYESNPQNIELHVPENCFKQYSTAPGWKQFGLIIDDLEPRADVENVIDDALLTNKNIYNQMGILIKKDASAKDINTLQPGIYIIGGKKILIK